MRSPLLPSLSLSLLILPLLLSAVSAQSTQPALLTSLSEFCNLPSSKPLASCNLHQLCQSKQQSGNFCHPLSILNSLCSIDNVTASVCNDWKSSTASSNGCNVAGLKCSEFPSWPEWVNSSRVQDHVFRICGSHSMPGCELCPKPPNFSVTTASPLSNCPSLQVYSKLCIAMPEMSNCRTWARMCTAYPDSVNVLPEMCQKEALAAATSTGTNPSTTTPTDSVLGDWEALPPMRMYFHQSEADIFLFREFVPRSTAVYVLVCFFIVAFTLIYYAIQALRIKLNSYFTDRVEIAKSLSKQPTTTVESLRQWWSREKFHVLRSLLATVEVMFGFIVMLIVMSYNIGWVLCVLVGSFLGQWIFGRGKIGSYSLNDSTGGLKKNVGDKDSLADGCQC